MEAPRPLPRILLALAALGVLLLAWWQVLALDDGIQERHRSHAGVPVTLLLPEGAARPTPGVVVAHGFAGSGTLMRTWALTLADAGMAVALPDLSGHGANRTPLDWWNDPDQFRRDVQSALTLLAQQPQVDAQRLALLGHSLGAGAVIAAAREADPPVRAVVAVSPGPAEVDATHPPNLLLMAGALEGPFRAAAESLLQEAGGEGGAMEQGTARDLFIVPGSEHIGVLFSGRSQAASVDWLTRVFALEPPSEHPASPMTWWLLHLLAVGVLWRALAPLIADPDRRRIDAAEATRLGRNRRPLGRAAISSAAATAGLFAIGLGIHLDGIGGMVVGPQFALWLALAGGVWMGLGARPPAPQWRDLAWGLALLGALALAFGALGARLWIPWWPPLHRLPYLPVLSLLILPWTVALATALQGRGGWRGFLIGLGIALITMVGMGLAAAVVEGMQFLFIILPLLPGMLALPLLLSRPVQRPWADGLALAAFLGWTLTAMFPLV
ncbi:MAG: alpha/beta hydrolase [Ectothiorhodospira sp.]